MSILAFPPSLLMKTHSQVPRTVWNTRSVSTMNNALNANFFVGIEGGVLQLHKRWFQFTVIYILDPQHRDSFSTSGLYELPDWIVEKLLAGIELAHIIDELATRYQHKRETECQRILYKRCSGQTAKLHTGDNVCLNSFSSGQPLFSAKVDWISPYKTSEEPHESCSIIRNRHAFKN